MIVEIFNVIAPVFILMLAGFLAVRFKAFPYEGVRYVMVFAQNFAVPLILFNAMVRIDFSSAYRPSLIVSYFFPMLIVFTLGALSARRLGRGPMSSTVMGFNAFFSNSVLMGLPIAERAFGAESLATNFVLISMHSPFAYVLGSTVMEFAKPREPHLLKTLGNVAKELAKNPLIIGIALGVIVNVTGLKLPLVLVDAIDMQARAAIPAALFAMGGALTAFALKGSVALIVTIGTIRLFVHAGLVLVLSLFVFSLPLEVARSAILMAAMPTGTNGFIFASLYDREKETAASLVFLTTVVSILTIPFWLWVIAQMS